MYTELHHRTPEGRYVVPLLFKTDVVELGGSFGSALACYRSLRTRLNKNTTLREEYSNFMSDYLESNHMSKLVFNRVSKDDGYFIPHHCVTKHDGPKIKFRVVFNVSKVSSNGVSLNDTLLAGPPLQIDLAQVVMRQRLYPIILTADICQMFRQVLIPNHQRHYQKILWDSDLSMTPQVYQLNTVTYGTTCAPYLAIRTLHQLAQDAGDAFPLAAKALKFDTFVDDIITGADSLQEALVLKNQLISLLAKAGMELRKWSSNHHEVLDDIPEDHKLTSSMLNLDRDHTIKILGLMWNPNTDGFMYQIHLPESANSKGQLLSEAARIFDPLGWLSPITIIAKLLIQELWKRGLGWDDPLPSFVTDKWINYKSQLPCIKDICIPRWIPTTDVFIDLIGFCDASEKGYAAVVYIRRQSSDQTKVSLVLAKTKLSPVKEVSIPRLELCAAMLLAQLISCVTSTLSLELRGTYLWTDSTVTLAWIQSPPHRWKTFVANRVSQITQLTKVSDWYHIRSFDNPADCAFRGLMPGELQNHPLWWSGPTWLILSKGEWPLNCRPDSSSTEESVTAETKHLVCLVVEPQSENELFSLFSCYTKLVKTTALCLRFVQNCRQGTSKTTGAISPAEWYQAMMRLAKLAQLDAFREPLDCLAAHKPVSKSLRKLKPFLDQDGLMRVGGRLRSAQINFHQKHPWLLPSKHTLTTMVEDTIIKNIYMHPQEPFKLY